jgi:hypothetical protein
VDDLDALVELRTELELIRRFGAGATPELLAALDRMIGQLWTQDRSDSPNGPDRIAKLEDMRTILGDALSPVNRQAIARIDQECPQAIAGVTMSSIEKDTQEFRQDVVDQLGASGDDDVDALLAAFEEAERETQSSPSAADVDTSQLDADLQALLADTGSGDLDESALAALADTIEHAADDPTADPLAAFAPDDLAPDDLVSEAVASELQEPADVAEPENIHSTEHATPGPIESDFDRQPPTGGQPNQAQTLDATIEEVTAQMTQQLSTAEEQLDAITSAFEAAAAELGQPTGDEHIEPASPVADAVPEYTPARQPAPAVPYAQLDPVPTVPASREPAVFVAAASPTPVRCDAIPPVQRAQGTTATRSVDQMKTQLKQARANILSELDDLLVVLERVDQMQGQAEASLQRARQFEQAAARANRAGQDLTAAEAEAAKARAGFDQAQARLNGARHAWEQAQQEASVAAAAAATFGA